VHALLEPPTKRERVQVPICPATPRRKWRTLARAAETARRAKYVEARADALSAREPALDGHKRPAERGMALAAEQPVEFTSRPALERASHQLQPSVRRCHRSPEARTELRRRMLLTSSQLVHVHSPRHCSWCLPSTPSPLARGRPTRRAPRGGAVRGAAPGRRRLTANSGLSFPLRAERHPPSYKPSAFALVIGCSGQRAATTPRCLSQRRPSPVPLPGLPPGPCGSAGPLVRFRYASRANLWHDGGSTSRRVLDGPRPRHLEATWPRVSSSLHASPSARRRPRAVSRAALSLTTTDGRRLSTPIVPKRW